MSRGQVVFLTVLMACVLIVTGVVVFDVTRGQHRYKDNQFTFQQTIGGVGLGAVIVPAWNFSDYDPRLQEYKGDDLYPIPGLFSYSPDRMAMVTSFGIEKRF